MIHNIGKVPVWILLAMFSVSHTTEPLCTAALPIITSKLHTTGNLAQLSSSIYFAGFALGILTLGRISDIFGRRKIVIAGLSLYCLSSIACSFTTNIEELFVLRFMQAFGVSVGSVIAQAMARDSYHGSELSQVYVSIAICMSFVPSIGSILGGYIVEYTGWEYNFRFLGLTSAILLSLCIKMLPETNRYITTVRSNKYIDVLKTVLSDRTVLLYAVIVGAFNGMMFGFYIEAPFIFIKHCHFTPSEYGRLGLLLSTAYLVGALINRQLVNSHISSKKIMITGLILSLSSCTALLLGIIYIEYTNLTDKTLLIALIFCPIMIHIIGHNFTIPLILRHALEDYAKVTGTAGSIFGSLYYFFVAVINYTVSYLHGTSIIPFAVLFFLLSALSLCSFIIIQLYKPMNKRYDFA